MVGKGEIIAQLVDEAERQRRLRCIAGDPLAT